MDTLRVLVCDDEAGMRQGVQRALRSFTVPIPDVDSEVQFEVEQADCAERALAMLEAAPPQIMLLDLKLPGMSGLDLLERIAPMHLETLVIMITAYASIETAVRATKQGAYDFLAKPFTPSELKDTLSKAAKQLLLARQARKLAQERKRVRFEFISVVAHELKAPINAVEGYLNIMKTRAAGDDAAVYDKMVERCLVRISGMRKMILDLLDLTRIESGLKKREIVELDVRDAAKMAIESVLPEAQLRGIAITLHADAPAMMDADSGEIDIILNNLVTNAVKYNRDNGKVDVTVESVNDEVRIRVADTGIGMSKADAGRLFLDFVRIKNDKTRQIMGSGLGLSTVKKVVTMYGGDVGVQSEPDVGSTFTAVLKKNYATAEPVAEAPAGVL
ncbi:MAG: ATP-binding protein [Candidatus Hydrogenedentales bacterium]